MCTTVLEDLEAGRAGPHGKGEGAGVCCLEEGGFGSDPTETLSLTGLGIKLLTDASFSSEDKRQNRLQRQVDYIRLKE